MSDNPDQDQKKHLPTEKRKADAARNGDIMVSKELASATMMAAAAGWLYMCGGWFFGANLDLIKQGLALTAADHRDFAPMENAGHILIGIGLPFFSLLAVTLLTAIATPALIGGLGWRANAMAFKGSRINPLSGLKRMFGAQGATELLKAVAKVLILGTMGYWVMQRELPAIMGLAAVDIKIAVARTGRVVASAFFALSLGLLIIAGIDVPAQFLQRRSNARPSRVALIAVIR